MALWDCECGTLFAVGLDRCPHCGKPSRQLTSLPKRGPAPQEAEPAADEPGQEPAGEGPKRRKAADGA